MSGFEGWTMSGGLGHQVIREGGGSGPLRALLGKTDYQCDNGVPIDFAQISQQVQVPATSGTLKFFYNIHSQDRYVPKHADDYDAFEVLINDRKVFSTGNERDRDQPDCAKQPIPREMGWSSRAVSLEAYKGQQIIISFRVANRNDRYYNTYVYLDSIEIE